MKKSFQLFLIFLFVFFVTDRLTYLGLTTLDKKVFSGQGVGKVNQFLSLKDSVDLLVFGSSRANHHINNILLDVNSFNMGVDGTKMAYAAALISTLNKKEQIIIVHIDQNTVFDLSYSGNDILTLINVANREKEIKKQIRELFPHEILYSQITNCYVYNGKVLPIIKNYIKPGYNYKKYHGYDPIYPSLEQKLILQKLLKYDSDSIFDNTVAQKINPITNRLIEYIKNKCDSNKSKLIFITSPTMKHISKETRLKTKAYFESKNIKYYDYSDFIDDSNPDFWKDFTHMSSKGADSFTDELKKIIQ